MIENYYISRKKKLLKDFDKTVKCLKKTMVIHYDDNFIDIIIRETRQKYESLIPELPYIGGSKNPLTESLMVSARALALYKVMKNHNKTANEIGKIIYEAEKLRLAMYPKLLRCIVGRLMFTRIFINKMKKLAAKSRKRQYKGDWVSKVVDGDNENFDIGIDYTECGICKFYHVQNADEFTKYICSLDFLMSRACYLGLARTMTIAEGFEKCDFRWKKGREIKQE
ncbi:L-2-amino-thiazoline-4-carboxylic acid hydrolase [Candidatus Parcubacteria bacterium]|nr:L-2-amino-thiazoline-4-carboxylic acid hydrolase [Candidatus Parcubacteria bacterium]